ncbi:Pyridoxal phosphate homeostasis protein [Planctomycetes bacterium MalM25]|nr:Pyridoxal phosphate homeostasis protein [Planctomycetes bacterium MalM25]
MAPELDRRVQENLARVRERIARACEAAGRSVDDVCLIGVSKYVGVPETLALVRAGCNRLGESRPQQLWEKASNPAFDDEPINWRLIGHLQRNKVKRTLESGVCNIDSVDSLRLLQAIDETVSQPEWRQNVLLEVNTSGDSEKHGFTTDELRSALAELDRYSHVQVQGLMTMAARGGDADTARRNFATLREIRDRVATPELPLSELSMGMSGDFEEAIHEGSTLVRVGSALWEGIK